MPCASLLFSFVLCCYAVMLPCYVAMLPCYAMPCPALLCAAMPCPAMCCHFFLLSCYAAAMQCHALLCYALLLCFAAVSVSLFTIHYSLVTICYSPRWCHTLFCAMHTMPCHAMSGFAAMLSILYAMPCHATMSLWLHALWVLLCHATPWHGIALVVFNQGSGGPSAQANCIITLYLIIILAYDTWHKWHMAMSGPMAMGWGYMTAHGAHGVQCTVYGSWPKCMASLCCWWQGQWHPAQKVYWYSGIVA